MNKTQMAVHLRRLSVFLLAFGASSVSATYSIVACEPQSGHCGVAIATHNLAVGHGAPFAVAETGAGVSQFETNPCHALSVLTALREGADASGALQRAMNEEKKCDDGLGKAQRQLAVVAASGSSAAFTGDDATGYAGKKLARHMAIIGNGLASDEVITAMWKEYERSQGELAGRLLHALEAGLAAGGQTIGVQSAALLVATPDGWPVDIDLRVDFAPDEAVAQLRAAYDANRARRLLFRAEREPDRQEALALLDRAIALAPNWDRIWRRAALLAERHGNRSRARELACGFRRLNPSWATASPAPSTEHCATNTRGK